MSEALEKVPLEEMVPQVRALHFVLCSHLPAIGSKLASMPPAKVSSPHTPLVESIR
jgi:hypothetical protein